MDRQPLPVFIKCNINASFVSKCSSLCENHCSIAFIFKLPKRFPYFSYQPSSPYDKAIATELCVKLQL